MKPTLYFLFVVTFMFVITDYICLVVKNSYATNNTNAVETVSVKESRFKVDLDNKIFTPTGSAHYVYHIRDTMTGKEYFGITGIGMQEISE